MSHAQMRRHVPVAGNGGGVVRRMNEVTLRRARLVLGWWVTVFGWVYYFGMLRSQLGQLSLGVAKSSTSL